jgi:NADP-dependent 3-hydroxy acid dehydrogenase YdfG
MQRTILITGASAGFGAAMAHEFARAGDKLILAARRLEKLHSLVEELAAPTSTHLVKLDVRHRDEVEKLFSNLPEEFSNIDVLVNNAGLALGLENAQNANLDDWDAMVDTNIKGLMYCSRLAAEKMASRNSGHIVNIGSIAGSWPYKGGNTYGATKAFVAQFSKNLRADLLGTRVRVTNIEPGMAESEFSLVRFKGDADKAAATYDRTEPLTPGDIARIVVWVTSQPAHVNINSLEVMPVCQAWDKLGVARGI